MDVRACFANEKQNHWANRKMVRNLHRYSRGSRDKIHPEENGERREILPYLYALTEF
jgi:hypothetical protein